MFSDRHVDHRSNTGREKFENISKVAAHFYVTVYDTAATFNRIDVHE